MKKEIHPEYYNKAKIQCACGAVLETGSTNQEIQVDICATCHPFYTGKQNLVDTAGIVDKFRARASKKSSTTSATRAQRTKATKAKKESETKTTTKASSK